VKAAGREEWLPRRFLEVNELGHGLHQVLMPLWLARRKRYVPDRREKKRAVGAGS
jgi:hypothetical protein